MNLQEQIPGLPRKNEAVIPDSFEEWLKEATCRIGEYLDAEEKEQP